MYPNPNPNWTLTLTLIGLCKGIGRRIVTDDTGLAVRDEVYARSDRDSTMKKPSDIDYTYRVLFRVLVRVLVRVLFRVVIDYT